MDFQDYLIQLHFDLPTQNTTYLRSYDNVIHHSNTNSINEK
jgi:hypothetical protein